MLSKKQVKLLIAICIFLAGVFVNNTNSSQKKVPSAASSSAPSRIPEIPTNVLGNQSGEMYVVKKVIDGDTIELSTGQKVRYIGIDTPETVDPRKPVQCFGKEAAEENKKLVLGKTVRLEKDVSETDKYGRLLRYVYVEDVFINDYLVRQGYAYVSTYPPDVKYQKQFLEAQTQAQELSRGLWSTCK